MATRYGETLFRSRLEAHWAAFFDLAGVEWWYEPKASIAGWWPDFRITYVKLEDGHYPVLAEVKPVAFSPVALDPAFDKALHPRWTLLLGKAPQGDYVGVLACKRDSLRTIGVRLTDEGLEGAPLDRRDYGSHAEVLWKRALRELPNTGVSAAINKVLERKTGKRLFDFGEEVPEYDWFPVKRIAAAADAVCADKDRALSIASLVAREMLEKRDPAFAKDLWSKHLDMLCGAEMAQREIDASASWRDDYLAIKREVGA